MLKEIFNENKIGIIFTYFLTLVEIFVISILPYLIGTAIDNLLESNYEGITKYSFAWIFFVLVATFRKRYDTRVFSAIYYKKALKTIDNLKNQNLDEKKISIRYGLVGIYSDFFEFTLPNASKAVFNIIISIFMIIFLQYILSLIVIPFVIIVSLVNYYFSKKMQIVEYALQETREVISKNLVEHIDCREVLEQQKDLLIKRSNIEASNGFFCDISSLFLEVVCLLIITSNNLTFGEITAIIMYLQKVADHAMNALWIFNNFRLLEMTNDLLGHSAPEEKA